MIPARAQRTGTALLVGLASLAVAGAVPRALFGVGPDAVHAPSDLAATITVCDRHYRGPSSVRSLAATEATDGVPPVLVDPAPLAACPGPNGLGDQPCHNVDVGPCATVVYVRVGPDAYAGYELVGGP